MNATTRWLTTACIASALFVAACGDDDDSDQGFGDDDGGGAGESSAANPYGRNAAAATPGVPASGSAGLALTDSTGGDDIPLAAEPTRKIIFTATLALRSEDVGRSFNDAGALARSHGGYVEKSQYASDVSDNTKRAANLSIRVPVQNYEALLDGLRTMGGVSVDSEGSNSNEVTEQYTDLQSRLRNLQRTEEQYLLLLKDAKTIAEILTVQDRLSSVRSQIEQIQGRLNVLDALTDFATINLTVAPVVAKVENSSGNWKLSEVFGEAWESSLEVARYVAAGAIVVFVAGVWLVIPLALAIFGTRRFRRRPGPAGPLPEA